MILYRDPGAGVVPGLRRIQLEDLRSAKTDQKAKWSALCDVELHDVADAQVWSLVIYTSSESKLTQMSYQ